MISAKQIAQSISEMISKGEHKDKILDGFDAFIERYNLQSLLPSILHHLEIFREEEKKAESYTVEIVDKKHGPHLDAIMEKIGVMMEKGNAEIVENAELIGGFKVTTKDTLYDFSLESQVRKMSNHIKN